MFGEPDLPLIPASPGFYSRNLACANFRAETVRSETVADIVNRPSTYMGVGEYKLTIQVDDGKKVVREFEVYFDNEKTVPILGRCWRRIMISASAIGPSLICRGLIVPSS